MPTASRRSSRRQRTEMLRAAHPPPSAELLRALAPLLATVGLSTAGALIIGEPWAFIAAAVVVAVASKMLLGRMG